MADPPSPTVEPAALPELVRRAQRGDAAAFAGLHAAFARVVHGIAVAHAGRQEAEDLTQEVFMTVVERLPDLRDAAAFPAWLCAAARNAAIDRRRRRRHPAAELPELADQGRSPVESAAARDAADRVLACIGTLPDAYRETLVLRLCEGLTGPEIALRTGLTHGSVRVNLTRGMALLRPLLQQAGLP